MKTSEKATLSIFAGLISMCWLILIFKVSIASIPYNPYSGSQINTYNFRNMLPQGWGFFTRNPREDNYFIYQKDTLGSYTQSVNPNNNSGNFFGIKRTSRIQSMEVGVLIQRLEKYSWLNCPEGSKKCIEQVDTLNPIPVLNTTISPTLCGEFILTQKQTTPWAWGKHYHEIDMPAKTIKINSICYNQATP